MRNQDQIALMAEHGRHVKAARAFRMGRLRRMHAEGLVTWQIAERMGISQEVVLDYFQRLGLKANQDHQWATL